MKIRKISKYTIGIIVTLLILYMLIPFKINYRSNIDLNNISRIFMTRDYLDPKTNGWESENIEISDKDELKNIISLIKGTPSIFSFKSITNYNGFSHDGRTDGYNIYLIEDDSDGHNNIKFTNKYMKVEGNINMTYRIFHKLEDYEKYFTD